MAEFQNRVGRHCTSPKGTGYASPGQGQASEARLAAALGLMRRFSFGRVISFAINRHATEANTNPRLSFVLDHTLPCGNANRSDDGAFAFLAQGSRPWLSYFSPSGQSCGNRY